MSILYCKTLLLLSRWDTAKVRDRFDGMGRFKGGLICKEWVNSVILNVITSINYRCNYMQVFILIEVQCKNMYVHNKCTVLNY